MTRPRFYKTEAIVLRHVPWGEADLILTLLTPGFGKLRVVSRGARRSRSKVGGHVDLLTRVSLSLTAGQGMDMVTGAQVIDSHRRLREDLDLMSFALYCADLTDAFAMEEQPVSSLYHLLRRVMEWLDAGDWLSAPLLLRYFEFRLLDMVGYLPELYRCLSCEEAIAPGGHAFSPSLGGVLCPACYNVQGRILPLSLNALKVLRAFQRQTPEEIARLRLGPELLEELQRALRSYITFILEREVNSARFLYRLQQLDARVRDLASDDVPAPSA